EVCMLKGNRDTNVIEKIDNFSSQNLGKNFIEAKTATVSTTANPQLLFQQLSSKFFNEMQDEQVMSSQASQRLEEWLSQHTLDELNALNQVAKEHFLHHGISFTVYEDKEGVERSIPFDIIPRVIDRKQWNMVALGSAQRVRALNLFLHDIYHQQDIL